jgi:hypothetical protein
MINVYLNYPNSIATIHQTSDCPRIHQHHTQNQRRLKIDLLTIETVLKTIMDGELEFRSEQGLNDVWLEIDFGDLEFEIAVIKFILRQLGKQYAPFDSLTPDFHC